MSAIASPWAHGFQNASSWQAALDKAMPILGHRNWIVIADSAYPSQISPGVQTISTEADHLEVLDAVLTSLAKQHHINGHFFLDKEFSFLDDRLANGATDLRRKILGRLGANKPAFVLHETLIGRLDEAGKTFTVLLLKTKSTIPYTTVFIQLDCGYWGAAKETALRKKMAGHKP